MTSAPDEEYDACLKVLAEWAKVKKSELYDQNIKSPANREDVLEGFARACKNMGSMLIQNLNSENAETLTVLGWPPELMECMKRSDVRTVLCDEVEQWFIRYPFVKSRLHLEELERENAGLQ